MMNRERYQKLMSIVDAVLDSEESERENILARFCDGDENLRQDVLNLLKHQSTSEDFLEDSIPEIALRLSEDSILDKRIGHYKLLREIGRGGMGAVYLAERDDADFRQQVAIKIIKRGMDTDLTLKRFRVERQILARLHHPNIAQLFDGGATDDGVPYFVMEYVEGVPVDDYCDEHQLTINERLELFRKVCVAVTYAHQNLIIHRDIKPSNILVTKDGTPKLLDFGIAKLLEHESEENLTATAMRQLTPEYASPEQLRGLPVSTATDVYSLGVTLYELLTGARPFSLKNLTPNEAISLICESEPTLPSEIESKKKEDKKQTNENQNQNTKDQKTNPESSIRNPQSLRGDLDNIILKALRKEPERRYSSVEQLSEDIRRHLEGLPVTATKDTWSYRANKFVKRNRLSVAAATLILISLLAGLGATLYQARIARRERAKAEQRFNDVRQLANSFLFEFHDSIENLPGSIPSRQLVVTRALEYLDKLSKESSGDVALQRELATAYERIGRIQGNSYYSNLGDTDGAMKSYLRSLEMRESLIKTDPNNLELQNELANSYEGVGDMLYTLNDLKGGLKDYEKALAIREAISKAEPNNMKYLQSLAQIYSRVADVTGMEGYPNLGDTNRALENYRKSVALSEELLKKEPDNLERQLNYATRITNLSLLQNTVGQTQDSISSGQRAIEIYEALLSKDSNNSNYKISLLQAYTALRYPLIDEMRFSEAEENSRRVVKMLEEIVAADSKNSFLRRSLGVCYNALGRVLTEKGEAKDAIEIHKRALAISESMLAADPENGEHLRDVGMSLEFLGDAELKAGDLKSAMATYSKAASIYEKNFPNNKGDDLSVVYLGLGKILQANGDLKASIEMYKRAVLNGEEIAKQSLVNIKKLRRLAVSYFEGGKALANFAKTLQGEEGKKTHHNACEWLRKSSDIWEEMKRTGKLSKLYEKYPEDVKKELNQCKIN